MNNDDISAAVSAAFPIVGIGASAGGLTALEQFLSHVPPLSGMAIVVVQHRDPHSEGMLVELLQRHTPMPVLQALDQMPVEPDHVYVIPPGWDLSLLHGVLHLFEPTEARGLRQPIDFFFKSLADDRQHNSIGVVLSGMGSDGTIGLRAIRQAGGASFAQSPASAQFDSMPRSAIDADVVDAVAPADELPAKVIAFVKRIRLVGDVQAQVEAEFQRTAAGFLDKILVLLRTHTGHDFSAYKKNTIMRRVERRMGLHQLHRIDDYLRYVRENPKEVDLLLGELLIGVTSFFRDPGVWEQIEREVLPALRANHPDGALLRAWIPGCSSGEEAYSLAMLFRESLDALKTAQRYKLLIFASDLDKEAISRARAGVYPESISADVSEARLKRFFVPEAAGYRVSNEIREMVIFAEQNVIVDPPFTRIDFLSCRNLLIYLEAGLQEKLLQLFHYSLSPGGHLLLGSSESVGPASSLFAGLPGRSRIYRRLDVPTPALPPGMPAAFSHAGSRSAASTPLGQGVSVMAPDLEMLVEQLVLANYAPAALLVSAKGEMLYVSGKTGKYLEPAAGKPSLNLFAMARDGLRQALSEAFYRAVRENKATTLKRVRINNVGPANYVDVVVQPLSEPVALSGTVLIVFRDVAAPSTRRPRLATAEVVVGEGQRIEAVLQELQHAREDARSSREEMQTSQEELKSTNEELQSTNEELQSTNEELTTSKEEMQSMNEELQTINNELRLKVAEISRASNDMRNLLDSTEIAILFLDETLHVRRFTPSTTKLFKLIPGDAGRSITDIVCDLDYPGLADDALEVLRTLVFKESDVPATDARWFRVRVMPYRTQDNRIDGLVITFADISASKRLEIELQQTQVRLQALVAGPISDSKDSGHALP
ncbi:chemotaxis protein CheB [Rhodoferax sp.]|uniref:chemotaxis protein CheB n=1 Tax=Rhodoferax sp. TaxID=50421 RepID=UPI002730DBE3|nr:chemotaxis protein CheB [Rhodoferax sp.]MDP2440495.1 chemotaxis protein CheB [Rhodoferax sp.]MDZ4208728.1 chemotaxis protein CheB [Rhodoferax sp.]